MGAAMIQAKSSSASILRLPPPEQKGKMSLEEALARTHLSLEKDAPETRPVQALELGSVMEVPEVGGLHHRYERRAA